MMMIVGSPFLWLATSPPPLHNTQREQQSVWKIGTTTGTHEHVSPLLVYHSVGLSCATSYSSSSLLLLFRNFALLAFTPQIYVFFSFASTSSTQ